ncbi:MAG TPA: YDG domain-containing protein [Alphaproteobacteria bacterium]|jgi:filamentous hemagglutinin family protein|nr:YDG domain-containing protein [Alphaproteobacteria bacterium]
MRDSRRIAPGRPRSPRCLLLIGCAGIALFSSHAEAAGTLPSGGHFVAGAGGIATSAGTTTVTQSSRRGIVDWNSFSVGKRSKVQFDNGSGATLNKVTGGGLSTIAGQLTATGSVYLINPNGVVVGPGGEVVTGGTFVASTRGVTDSRFMAGGTQTFTGASNGAVVNDGTVVSQNGNVVLIGHAVTNRGRVEAAKGAATLASGDKIVMTDANGPNGVYVAKGKSDDTTSDGQVRAAAVELASAGGNVYALAGNRAGLISATGTRTIDGQVWLTAPKGAVDVGGAVAAKTADGNGGAIVATGDKVIVGKHAVIDASGAKAGGTIKIGGGPHGKDTTVANARTTTVAAGAMIDASATQSGNGGNIAVWSNDTTRFAGTALATGGPQGGDGGWIETSGHRRLSVIPGERVSTLATDGKTGTWLLDPSDIVISGSTTAHGGFDSGTPINTFTPNQDLSTLETIDLTAALALNNVVVTTSCGGCNGPSDGKITVIQAFSWSANTSLTLHADNDIEIDGAITGGGPIVLSAGNTTAAGSISINAPLKSTSLSATAGTAGVINLSFNGVPATVETTGGGQTYNSPVVLVTDLGTLKESGNGPITFMGTVDANPAGGVALSVDAGSTGTVTFKQAVGGIGALDGFSSTGKATLDGNITTNHTLLFTGALTLGADVALTSSGPIDFEATVDGPFDLTADASGQLTIAQAIGGSMSPTKLIASGHTIALNAPITTNGPLSLTSTQASTTLAIDGALTATGNTVTLSSQGAITQSQIITAGTLTGSAVGGATFDGSNAISAVGAFSSAGNFVLDNTVALTQTGGTTINAGTGTITIDNGSAAFTQSGTLTTTSTSASAVKVQTAGALSTATITASSGKVTLGGAGITLAASVSTTGLTLTSTGIVKQTGGVITASTLTGSSVGGATLTRTNMITTLNSFTDTGAGNVTGFSLTDGRALTVGTGATVSSTGQISLTTSGGTGSTLTLDGGLAASSDTVTLSSTGTITQTGGIINAATLTGNSVGGAALTGSNVVGAFESFANTGSGAIAFTNTALGTNVGGITTPGDLTLTVAGVTIDGSLTAGASKTLTITASGAIDQTGGIVTAGTLTGTAGGAVSMDKNNAVGTLAISNSGAASGNISFTDTVALTLSDNESVNNLTIKTTTGAGITVTGHVHAGIGVTLDSAGTIVESGSGFVESGASFSGSSVGGADLGGANLDDSFESFTNTGGGDITYKNTAIDASIGGISTSGDLTLTFAGARIDGSLTAGAAKTLTLDSSGTVGQLLGTVTAGTLTGSSVGGMTFKTATLTNFGAWTDTGVGSTGISLTNSQALTITGALSTGSLTVAAAGDLKIGAAGSVSASAGATLATTGNFTNLAGASAITVGAGKHWLVYSSDPTADTDGGLTPDFIQYAATYHIVTLTGTAAAATGDGFLYSLAPTLTLSGITKTYDGTTGLTGAEYGFGGGVTGDSIALGGSPAGSFADKNAASGIDVTVSGLTVTATRDGVTIFGYAVTPVTGGAIGTIAKADLSVGLTGTVTKTYDGTTAAALGTGNLSLSGVIGSDSVTVSAGSSVYGTSNAKTGIRVTAAGYTLSGADAGNYALTTSSGSAAIGTIDPKTITAGLTGTAAKTYDGTTAAGLNGSNYTLTGIVTGDTVSLNDPSSGAYADGNAGRGITVTATGLALKGADAGNYVLAATSTTADIGKIDPKTVTVGLTGKVDKFFDGTTQAKLGSGNYTLTGVLSGDGVSLNDPTTGAYAQAQTGSGIAVTVGGLALSGADARNYRLASATATANIGEIDPNAPSNPFIPLPPPQPPGTAASPQTVAASAIAVSHSVAVPKPEMAEMAKLSGCGGEDFVAVVPGEDGHVGAVVVESEGSKTVLHAAYAGCSGSRPVITSPQEVNRLFGGALAARPTPPAAFQLFYRTGSVTLEPDALAVFDRAYAEVGRRQTVDVVVAGFTDTVGTEHGNDLLSLARAQAVARLLETRGLKAGSVMTVGRGARGLLVPTAPQVAEDKNRRVEITVR